MQRVERDVKIEWSGRLKDRREIDGLDIDVSLGGFGLVGVEITDADAELLEIVDVRECDGQPPASYCSACERQQQGGAVRVIRGVRAEERRHWNAAIGEGETPVLRFSGQSDDAAGGYDQRVVDEAKIGPAADRPD